MFVNFTDDCQGCQSTRLLNLAVGALTFQLRLDGLDTPWSRSGRRIDTAQARKQFFHLRRGSVFNLASRCYRIFCAPSRLIRFHSVTSYCRSDHIIFHLLSVHVIFHILCLASATGTLRRNTSFSHYFWIKMPATRKPLYASEKSPCSHQGRPRNYVFWSEP
jgi:hypothetical protein